MTDAVKMAIEALRPFASAAGHVHPFHPDEATSLDGFPMSDFRRAAQALAALEQAGEPVGKLHYSGDVMEAVQKLLERGRATLDSEGYLVANPAEAPLTTLQRLGQEFDAGQCSDTVRPDALRDEQPKRAFTNEFIAQALRRCHKAEFPFSERSTFTVAADRLEADAAATAAKDAEIDNIRATLLDPVAVHMNMLRGSIARPSARSIIHVYGEDAIRAALSEAREAGAKD